MLIWFVVYQVSFLFKNTRSTKIVIGSTIIALLYIMAQVLKLEGLTQVFQAINIVQVGTIVLIIIFSQEIKEALTSIGIKRVTHYINEDSKTVEAINQACLRMSANQVGALILIAKRDNLNDLAKDAIPLNANVTSQMIETLFFEPTSLTKGNNPLHDGAIIIADNKIVAAKVICKQLSESIELSHQAKGTRHAAGLGFAEQYDLISVIVSHESGDITIAEHNEKTRWNIDNADLLQELKKSLGLNNQKPSLTSDIKRWFLERKIAKTIALSIAFLIWSFSTASMTISVEIKDPSIYPSGQVWAEGNYVLKVEDDSKNKEVMVYIKNWAKVYLIARPDIGGKYALKNAVEVKVTEESILENLKINKKRMTSSLKISNDFEEYVQLNEKTESEDFANIKIQTLKSVPLKELIQFQMPNHPEIESIVGISKSILVLDKFNLQIPCFIDLRDKNVIVRKNGMDSWQDILTQSDLKKDYPDFSGAINLNKIPELAEIAPYNEEVEVRFRITVKATEVKSSEEENSLKKELSAIKDIIEKGPDSLMEYDGKSRVDHPQMISAYVQKIKAQEKLIEINKQIGLYTKKRDDKKLERNNTNFELTALNSMENLNETDKSRLEYLETKTVQLTKEQNLLEQILQSYKEFVPQLEKQVEKSNEIYEKFKLAFQPVLKIYDEARKKQEERLSIQQPSPLQLNVSNIIELTSRIEKIRFDKPENIELFISGAIESLETYLKSPLEPRIPGSLHEYLISKKTQFERLDLLLDNLNTHLNQTEMPSWLALHKVQTFKNCEEIYFQNDLLFNLEEKIKYEREFSTKSNIYRSKLFETIQKSLNELIIRKDEAKVLFSQIKDIDKKLPAFEKKLDGLLKDIEKHIATYAQEVKPIERKTKSILILANNTNPILIETKKGLDEWPKSYQDYSVRIENEQTMQGHSIIRSIFELVHSSWNTLTPAIQTIQDQNADQLKKYAEYTKQLKQLIKELSAPPIP